MTRRTGFLANLILSLAILAQLGVPHYASSKGNASGTAGNVNKAVEILRASEPTEKGVSDAIDVFVKSTEKGGKDAVAPLIQAMGDQGKSGWLVRLGAISALAKIGDPAVSSLFKELNNPSPQVSFGAADALALIGGSAIVDQAEKRLQAGGLQEKHRLMYMLGRVEGNKSRSLLIASLRDYSINKEASLALRQLGEDSISDLIEVVKASSYSDPDSLVAGYEAARSLSQMGEPALRELANTVGACSLSTASTTETLSDSGAACGCVATYGLVFMGDAAIPTLLGFASNFATDTRSRNTRGLAMQGLSDMGAKAVNSIISFINARGTTSNPGLAAKVGLTILGSIADRSAESFLTTFQTRESDPALQRLATWALDKIQARQARENGQPAPAPKLKPTSGGSLPELIDQLRKAEIAGDDTATPFTNIVAAAQAGGESAIPDLLKALADQGARDWVVRMAAVSGLAAVGDPAIPVLSEKVNDPNPQISFGAADALAQIGGTKVVEIAERKLTSQNNNFIDKQRAIYILGRVGNQRSIEILAQTLKSEQFQFDAAIALSDIGVAALPELIKVVQKSSYQDWHSVRAAFTASRILASLGERGFSALASVHQKSSSKDQSPQVAASYGWTYSRERTGTSIKKKL